MDRELAKSVLTELVNRGADVKELDAELANLDEAGRAEFFSAAAQRLGLAAAPPTPGRVLPEGAHIERPGFKFEPDAKPGVMGAISDAVDTASEMAATTLLNLPGGDEAAAALTGDEQMVGQMKGELADKYPLTTGLGPMAVTAGPSAVLGAAKATSAALPQVLKAQHAMGTYAQGAIGAITGALEGDTLEERLINAGFGSILGAGGAKVFQKLQKLQGPEIEDVAAQYRSVLNLDSNKQLELGAEGVNNMAMMVAEAGEAARRPETLAVFLDKKKETLTKELEALRDQASKNGVALPARKLAERIGGALKDLFGKDKDGLASAQQYLGKIIQEEGLAGQPQLTPNQIQSLSKRLMQDLSHGKKELSDKAFSALDAVIRDETGNLVESAMGVPYKHMSKSLGNLISTQDTWMRRGQMATQLPTDPVADKAQAVISAIYSKVGTVRAATKGATPTRSFIADITRKAYENKNKPWSKVLLNAAERGPAALNAAHYTLMNRDAEYRKEFQIEEGEEIKGD